MILSMTGFGRGEALCQNPDCRIVAEISSINRKQLDLRLSLPREFAAFESELRNRLVGKVSRGTVNGRVFLERGEAGVEEYRINLPFLRKLIVVAEHEAAGDVTAGSVAELMQVPGVLTSDAVCDVGGELKVALFTAFDAAVDDLVAMRRREGEALTCDLTGRLAKLEELLSQIRPKLADIPRQLKAKLLEKLAAENIPVDMNDDRLLKEALFFADKSDTTEEVTRLESHFAQFKKLLAAEASPGRSLDFLMQEMFREITTLGNKAGTPEVSPLTVEFKSELEKIREQVQNIE